MATEFESLAILLLQVLVLVCALQVVLGLVIVYYMTRVQELVRGAGVFHEQPVRARPIPPREPAPPPPPPSPTPAPPPPVPGGGSRPPTRPGWAVEILEGRRDIRGSIQAICDKFSLRDLIITTRDGLVVVSLTPGVAEEAARLSGIHRRGGKADGKDLHFLPVVHRGDELLVILRTDRIPDERERRAIEKDVAQILNWWL